MKRWVLCAFEALVPTAMVSIALFWHQEIGSYAFMPESSLSTVIPVTLMLFLFFIVWFLGKRKKWSASVFLTAILFSVFFTISTMISDDLKDVNTYSLLSLLVRLIGILPLWYAAVHLLYAFLDQRQEKRHTLSLERKMAERKGKLKLQLIYAGILLAMWIPYLVCYYPGNMTIDTANSILHFYGALESPNNPWILNCLYGTVIRIGDSFGTANIAFFCFCLLQGLLFVWLLSEMLVQLWTRGMSPVLLGLLLLVYGAIPSFSAYAFCMGKDSSFALCLLWLGVNLLKVEETGLASSKKNWVLFAVSCIFVPLTRNGVWVAVLFLLAILFRKVKEERRLLAGTALLVLLTNIGIPRLLSETNSVAENLSIPLQQVARTFEKQQEQISPEELIQYKSIMKQKYWEKYKTGISDPVKKHFEQRPTEAYLTTFFNLWFTELQRFPRTYMDAAILMNYAYYVPLADRSDLKTKLFLGLPGSRVELLEENTTLRQTENAGLTAVKKLQKTMDQIPLLRLLTHIGFYSWLLMGGWIYCISRKKGSISWLLLFMPLIVFIGCCFSPVNGYYRYAYPMILVTPVFTGAAVSLTGNDYSTL